MSSLEGIDTFDNVLEVRSRKVLQVDMAVLDDLERQTRELMAQLDPEGTNVVTRGAFVEEVVNRPELAALFDVPRNACENAPTEAKGALGEVFDEVDFGKVGKISVDELFKCFQHQLTVHLPVTDPSAKKSTSNGTKTPKDATEVRIGDSEEAWDSHAQDIDVDLNDSLAHRAKCNALKYPTRPGTDPRNTGRSTSG